MTATETIPLMPAGWHDEGWGKNRKENLINNFYVLVSGER